MALSVPVLFCSVPFLLHTSPSPAPPPTSCRNSCRDDLGMTPVMWACFHNRPRIVKRLLKHGADLLEKDNDGKTAMHFVSLRLYDVALPGGCTLPFFFSLLVTFQPIDPDHLPAHRPRFPLLSRPFTSQSASASNRCWTCRPRFSATSSAGP